MPMRIESDVRVDASAGRGEELNKHSEDAAAARARSTYSPAEDKPEAPKEAGNKTLTI